METYKERQNIFIEKENKREKIIKEASAYYKKFLETILQKDISEDVHMKDTPMRVAKMFYDELFKGVTTIDEKIIDIRKFENINGYDGLILVDNIKIKTMCAHHMMPIIGKAIVAYIPKSNTPIIGLSKINRIVEYLSKKPTIQELLTTEIHNYLDNILLDNLGIAVTIIANHLCVAFRGVEHEDSIMKTQKLSGAFMDNHDLRAEYMSLINIKNRIDGFNF